MRLPWGLVVSARVRTGTATVDKSNQVVCTEQHSQDTDKALQYLKNNLKHYSSANNKRFKAEYINCVIYEVQITEPFLHHVEILQNLSGICVTV